MIRALVEVADRLDYDFTDASRGAGWHAVRVATFDAAVRRFLTQHPAGTVVALGEGLETQFWRLDNGRMQWVTVDLPETLKLRQQTAARWSQATQPRRICAGQRLAGPAGPAQPVLVTAQGLLPYFRREQVHELIAAIARRLPSGSLVFDVVPERMLQMLRRLPDRESAQANRLWSWVFNTEDREAISAIPGVTSVHDLTPPLPLGVAPLVLAGVRRLPRRMRYALPVGPVLEVTFR